jgi:hypothetical protein
MLPTTLPLAAAGGKRRVVGVPALAGERWSPGFSRRALESRLQPAKVGRRIKGGTPPEGNTVELSVWLFAPKGRPFSQPRATPWGLGARGDASVGPTDQQFTANSANGWPVGPVLLLVVRVPRALPWAGRTAAPSGRTTRRLFQRYWGLCAFCVTVPRAAGDRSIFRLIDVHRYLDSARKHGPVPLSHLCGGGALRDGLFGVPPRLMMQYVPMYT